MKKTMYVVHECNGRDVPFETREYAQQYLKRNECGYEKEMWFITEQEVETNTNKKSFTEHEIMALIKDIYDEDIDELEFAEKYNCSMNLVNCIANVIAQAYRNGVEDNY